MLPKFTYSSYLHMYIPRYYHSVLRGFQNLKNNEYYPMCRQYLTCCTSTKFDFYCFVIFVFAVIKTNQQKDQHMTVHVCFTLSFGIRYTSLILHWGILFSKIMLNWVNYFSLNKIVMLIFSSDFCLITIK